MVSYSNLYDYELYGSEKNENGNYVMTIAFIVVIGAPLVVVSPIIIIIIFIIYFFCKKYGEKKTLDFSQHPSSFVFSNSVAYHMITQAPIDQEKLLFSKHL